MQKCFACDLEKKTILFYMLYTVSVYNTTIHSKKNKNNFPVHLDLDSLSLSTSNDNLLFFTTGFLYFSGDDKEFFFSLKKTTRLNKHIFKLFKCFSFLSSNIDRSISQPLKYRKDFR